MLRVLYLAGGYPSKENPSHGIFNKRAAEKLCKKVNLTVVQYRLFKPGRRIFQEVNEDEFKRVILCVPFIPFMGNQLYGINNSIFKLMTRVYLNKYLKQTDIVHASDGNLGVFSASLKKKYKYKLIVQFIGGDLNQDLPPQLNKWFLKNWMTKIDGVAFNSKSLFRTFEKLFETKVKNKIVYRGVDLNSFEKKIHHDQKEALIFYFIGGLPNYRFFDYGRNTKGGITLLEAWSILDKKGIDKNIKLKFAGPDSDIDFAKKWRDGLNNPESLEIIGRINPNKIAEFHNKGDVIIVPSLEEGLPNAAMEAAASSNMIIGTDVGGIPEVLKNKENGLLIAANHAQDLASSIMYVIANKQLVSNYGKKSRELMEQNFDSNLFAVNYVNFYKKILS